MSRRRAQVQQRTSTRSNRAALSLEEYRSGQYHPLDEARSLLGYTDDRSLRKHIRLLDITLYSSPLNKNFALISHQDLLTIAEYTRRPLAASTAHPRDVPDADIRRQLADLQVQYARDMTSLEHRLALAEALRAQDAEMYEQSLASLRKQHDLAVAQLRETIKDLRTKLAESTR